MSKKIQRFLEIAYQKTFDSTHSRPMAAVIVKGSRVLSIGVNQNKTHPKQKKRLSKDGLLYGWHRLHAELDCLIRSQCDVSGGTIYIVRRNSIGVGVAKPCSKCEFLLREYGIKKVIFSIPKDLECFGVMEL